jgi:hypothetical protein
MKNYIKEYFENRKAKILKEQLEIREKIAQEEHEKTLATNKKHLEETSDIVEKDFSGTFYLPGMDEFLDFEIKDYKFSGKIVGYKNGKLSRKIFNGFSRYHEVDSAILVEDLQKFKKELSEKKEKKYLESIQKVISYVPKKIDPSPKQVFEEIVLKSFESVKCCYPQNQDGTYKLFDNIHTTGNVFGYNGTVTENDFAGMLFEDILKEYIKGYQEKIKRLEQEPSEIIVKIDNMLKGKV